MKRGRKRKRKHRNWGGVRRQRKVKLFGWGGDRRSQDFKDRQSIRLWARRLAQEAVKEVLK